MKFILALALGALSATAHAEIVTYTFSGTFDAPYLLGSGASGTGPLFSGLVKQGDHFSGQFSFDIAAPKMSELNVRSFYGAYYQMQDFQFKASDAFNNAVPAWTAPTQVPFAMIDGPSIGVGLSSDVGGHPPDQPSTYTSSFTVQAAAPDSAGHSNWSINLGGLANTTEFLDGRIPVGFNDIVSPRFTLRAYDDEAGRWSTVDGTLQIQYVNANVSPVPEPSSALMLLAGLAGVGGIARLRRRA